MKTRSRWIVFGLIIIFLSFSFILPFPSPGTCQVNQSKIISSFEKRVDIFNKFFSKERIIMIKEKLPNSYPGFVYYFLKVNVDDISYDVQKTNSVISPYVGYIYIQYRSIKSMCGDVNSVLPDFPGTYFSNIEESRINKDKESCYKIVKYTILPGSDSGLKNTINDTVKFTFSFQKGNWVFKDVRPKDGKEEWVLNYVLGKSVNPNRVCLDDNKFWRVLID